MANVDSHHFVGFGDWCCCRDFDEIHHGAARGGVCTIRAIFGRRRLYCPVSRQQQLATCRRSLSLWGTRALHFGWA